MGIEQRISQAAESIMGDASLTGDITDEEASLLLNWGAAFASRVAGQTVSMDDANATAYLDGALRNLRRVIRRINKLVGEAGDLPPDDQAGYLQGIFEAAVQVPGLQTQPLDFVALAAELSRLTAVEKVRKMILILDTDAEVM